MYYDLQPPTACAGKPIYSYTRDAVAFGGVKRSHASILVKRRAITKRWVNLYRCHFDKSDSQGLVTQTAHIDSD